MGNTLKTYTFSLLPGITLTDEFVVSNEVLEHLPVRCSFFDVDGQLIWMNRRAKEDAPTWSKLEPIAKVGHTGEGTTAALPDGRIVRLIAVRDLMGSPCGVLVVETDEVRWKNFASLHTGIAVCENERFIMANPAACKWVGVDLVGKTWDEIPGFPSWASVVEQSRAQSMVEVRADHDLCIHRVGSAVVVVEFIPRSLIDGQSLSVTALAEMVHEIRNPLTAVRGFLELALHSPERGVELLRHALTQVERLDLIASDLLSASRPLTPVRVPVSVREAGETAWAMVDPRIRGQTRIAFRTELGTVQADRDLLHQVLLNLLKNAAEAMAGQGTIWISFNQTELMTAIRIEDEGPGIPEEVLAGLFGRSHTTKPTGSGLGLLIVRRLMLAHKGQVVVRSAPTGTSIELRFPGQELPAGAQF